MRRLWWLALIAVIAAAVVLWSGPPTLRPPAPEGPEDPYVPRELPAGVQGRLVVWDHPWPHANPVADPSRFQGEYPETWARRLEAAVEAFRRRFPQVEVVVDVRPFAPGTERPAAGEDPPASEPGAGAPDVVAVWWGGPLPEVEDLVPLNRYLTEAIQAEYHPAAWPLVEAGGVYWGWPRWIGFHYWLVPRAAAGTVGRGWTLDDALELAAGGLLAPPASGGLLLELAAGRMKPLTPPDDAVEDAGAGGDDQTGVEPAAAQLAAALGRLRPLLAAGGAVGQRLVDAGFGLAGGFGPALGHWAVSPPLSGRGRPDEHSLELLVPPAWMGDPAAVPVLSAGAYVIPRKDGPDEGVRAQLAVELARHLSTWQGDAAVARLLAVPAHNAALERWRAGAPLAPAVTQRLLSDLDRSTAEGMRAYGRPEPSAGPLDPAIVHDWWRRWLDGEVDDETLARLLLGRPAAAPTLAGARDASP